MKRTAAQMGRPPAAAGSSKGSKAPGQLSAVDLQVYEVIKESGNVGIWTRDIKYKASITDNQVKKSINTLLQHQKIKAVHNISNPTKKMYMLIELEPSEEVSGGKWYSGKDFDNELVSNLKMVCLKFVAQQKVATIESITDFIRKSGLMSVEFQTKEIKQVVDALVLERDLEEVVSTGTGIFSSVPVRKVCYRFCKKGAPEHAPFVGVPCGFLVVLDNVWFENSEEWEPLRKPLSCGARGSRIVVTSRSEKVSLMPGINHACQLEPLPNEHSWRLFHYEELQGRGDCVQTMLERIGREILKK
ncbi:DNA-directed RNA polymerase III subunit [Nymphaea thermarum]|nr:DNA-directed RNA polymerase III subunit [Nymphaea thermarum]